MMKAIIIDDEPKGRNILQHLIAQNFPNIKVVATAAGADEIAAVANYITARFGAKGSSLTARDVAVLRAHVSN